ncbi:MAG: sulfatase [Myxococcota bacterium]
MAEPAWRIRAVRRATCLPLILAGLAIAAAGCDDCTSAPVATGDGPAKPSIGTPRSIVLIGVDTLRVDHLGLYGARRATSPFLDRVAGKAHVFDRAFATSPWTLPSFASMLTGLDPTAHGAGIVVRDDPAAAFGPDRIGPKRRTKLDPAVRTLAEQLTSGGLATLAVVQNPNLDPAYGIDRGFDIYDHYEDGRKRRADAAIDRALELLDGLGGQRFFLFLHLIDPHLSYDAPPPARGRFTGEIDVDLELPIEGYRRLQRDYLHFSPMEWKFVEAAYDEEIAFVDQQLETFFAGLRKRGLEDDTLVILTADHGEEFLEHGGFEHGHTLYNELLHVPFLVWGPGVVARRQSLPISVADVAPTILDAVGLGVPDGIAGRSLWAVLSGHTQRAPSRVLFARGTLYGPELRAAIRWPFKLVERPEDGMVQLFDLDQDPAERVDLSESDRERTRELRSDLDQHIETGAHGRRLEIVDPGSELLEDLRELGYVE